MYRCDRCGEATPPRTPLVRRVVSTRPKNYPTRLNVCRIRVDGKVRFRHDPGGTGEEIEREIALCPECARLPSDR